MIKEFNFNSVQEAGAEKYVNEAYEKGAQNLKALVLKNLAFAKDRQTEGRQEIKQGLEETMQSLNKKYFFSLNPDVLYAKSLESLIIDKSRGEFYVDKEFNLKKSQEAMDKVEEEYLNLLFSSVYEEAIAGDDDFHRLSSEKLSELKRHGLDLDDNLVSKLKKSWAEKWEAKKYNYEA